MVTKTYHMVKERETKATVVFTDLHGGIKSFYMPKEEFQTTDYPKKIDITVEYEM